MRYEIKEKITKNAISLEKYGLASLAWRKEDAQLLIQEIIQDEVGVLGGEVYKLTPPYSLIPLVDNWSCESNHTESQSEYYLRSKRESLDYIDRYPIQPGEHILFSITFTEQI